MLNQSEAERKWVNGPLRKSEKTVAEDMARMRGQVNEQLTVVERDGNAFVGQCGFLVRVLRPAEVEVYCYLKGEHHRKGYGREVCTAMIETALVVLHMEWVTAIIHPKNSVSIKIAERIGFELHERHKAPGTWQHGHSLYVIDLGRFERARLA